MHNKTGKIKLGSFCYFIGGSGFPISLQGKSTGDYPFYKVSDMNLQGNERYLSKANNYVCLYDVEKYNWKTIPQGAVCFAKVGAALLLNRRRIATSNCLIDNNMMAAVPKEPSMSVFLYWLFQTIDFADFVQIGALPSVNQKQLSNIEVYIPSNQKEQKTIATILDTIAEAIAAAEAQLAKQEKIKQGLLQDLLTRGIDENGQIRPHWEDRPDLYKKTELGLIPKAWQIYLLGNICIRGGGNVQTGPFGSQLHAEDYKEQGVPIITVEHLNELFITHENLPLVGEEDYFRLKKYDLKIGDLVFSRVGAIDRCVYVTEKEDGWLFSGRCLRVRAGSSINSKYLAFVLNSHRQRQWILNAAVGSTMACLNTSILSNVPITEPAEYEQNFVADNLFEIASVANELKADVRKLQSIKTGLMQDLLTGQRRVTPELIRQVEILTGSA